MRFYRMKFVIPINDFSLFLAFSIRDIRVTSHMKKKKGRGGEKRERRGRGERNSFCGTHRYADRNGRKFVCPRAFSKERYFGNARVAKFFRDFFSFGESIPQFCEIILLRSFFLLYWRDKLVNGEIRLKEKNYSCFLIPEKGKYFVVRRKSYF